MADENLIYYRINLKFKLIIINGYNGPIDQHWSRGIFFLYLLISGLEEAMRKAETLEKRRSKIYD